MSRLDWDRVRRVRPLEGAEAKVDPDGGVLWERTSEVELPFGSRRPRFGVVVRRRPKPIASEAAPPTLRAKPMPCPRCGETVAQRKALRHALRCPRLAS